MVALPGPLNDQQRDAVGVNRHCSLVSCPGSGKTRTIIAKLLACVDDVRKTPRKIGCITYTNAAVYEIERRLREEGSFDDDSYCLVGTIHSFCLNALVRPFGSALGEPLSERKILPPDSDLFKKIVAQLVRQFDLNHRAADYFQNIGFHVDGTLLLPRAINEPAARAFFEQVQAEGCMTFSELLYFAYRIITAQPFIAQALSSRFAWLLVDEFQDTTELQVEILKLIVAAGRTKLFVVGDPNQSIYSFAGARPDLMAELAETLSAETGIRLFGNYRSSEKIVAFSELICPTNPSMKAVGENADYPAEPNHYHVADPFEGIEDYFLPALESEGVPLGEAAVLASWWIPLYHLGRKLRDVNVPIIGPGARPYKRSTAFARFAEEVCAYLATDDMQRAVRVQRAFFFMLIELVGYVPQEATGIKGKHILVRVLHGLSELRESNPSALPWLHEASREVAQILRAGEAVDSEQAALIIETGDAMLEQVKSNLRSDAEAFSVDELGLFTPPSESLRLQTIHAAKGREFDAVALIDFHEGRLPYYLATTPRELAEERRKLYVACTRARRLLMLFTDSSDYRNRPSRFLKQLRLG